jgi:hypothetical protein
MAIKVRLPNGRYIKVNTEDQNEAKEEAIAYYSEGGKGFVDATTQQLGQEFDKKFDRETGVNAPWLRTKLATMETPAGKEKVLVNAVGSKGFTRDSSGSLALTPDGLKTLGIVPKDSRYVVIDESGFSANDFADFAGLVGPIAGSIAGSIITRGKIKPKVKNIKTINLLDLGKISLGTGAGAAAGKTSEEGFEFMMGLQDNSAGELTKIAAQEFAIGAGAEFGLGAIGKLLKHTFGNRVLARSKEEPEVGRKLLLEASAASKGVYDPVTKKTYRGAVALAALESPILGRLQPILETISDYKGRTDALSNMLFTDLKNLYRSTNDLSEKFNMSFEDLQKIGFADTSKDVLAGRAIQEQLKNSYSQTLKESEKALSNINKSVNDVIGNFDLFKQPATEEAGAALRSFTEQAFDSWKKTSDELYAPLENAFTKRITAKELDPLLTPEQAKLLPESAFDEPIRFIQSRPLKAYAKQLEKYKINEGYSVDDELMKDLKYLKNLGGPNGEISLGDIVRLRGELASKLRITPEGTQKFAGLEDLERGRILQITDNILKDLENGGSLVARLVKDKEVDTQKVQQYLKLTRIANNFYSKGLQAFDRSVTKKIFDDAEAGGWNIDQVMTKILLKKNNGEELARYLDTLDASTAGLRKQKKEGTKIVARSKSPERVPLEIGKEGRRLLKDLDIKIDEPDFLFKDQAIKTLQKEFIRNITKNIADPEKAIDYNKIANAIDSYGTTGDILFGGTAKKRDLIQTLKDADRLVNTGSVKEFEDLVIRSTDAENLTDILRRKVEATEEISNMEKLNVFSKIQKGTIDPEEITSALFKPANSEEIGRVKDILGPESDLYKQFQLSSMRKLLDSAINPGEDVITKLFNEGGFAKAIDSYGEATLRETFGEEQFKQLSKVRDRLRFTVGREGSGGNLFTTGFIFNFIFKPLQAARVFAPVQAVAYLMARPSFVKWLSGEITDKEIVKELPTLIDYTSKMFGIPVTPVAKQFGQVIPRGFIEGEENIKEQIETQGISPEAPLTEALPELRQKQQQKSTLDLPDLLPPLPQTMQRGQVSAALIPDPITRDLANLMS